MREETNLDITIERLILDDVGVSMGVYKRLKTYLCKVVAGDAQPGYEPEIEAANQYAIAEVQWFDLRNPIEWESLVRNDPFTFPLVQRIRAVLGYAAESSTSGGE